MQTFYPGTKVSVYIPSLHEYRPAIVTKWYGYASKLMAQEYGYKNSLYPSLIDVYLPQEGIFSSGHFTDYCKLNHTS